jgi:5'-nucleotidase
MKILLSNDDGYQAPGINLLEEVLSEFAEIFIVAPDRNRSGASNSLTLDRPLTIKSYKKNAYYVNGTPTDCVHLALSGLFKHNLPDMVVSGINDGSNVGDDVLYSGTVAAAIQGRFLGLPSMAVSLNGPSEHFSAAAEVAKKIVKRLVKNPLPASTILNVNVPDVKLEDMRGFEVTRLGSRYNSEKTYKEIDPRGNEVYWIGLPGPEQDSGPGTDFYAIRANKVSVTPLRLDFTNYVAFEELSAWMQELSL